MEENKLKTNWLFSPPPSPIEERVCKCGCGHTFQPRRRDQVYLNNQHANYGYNHNERKKKMKYINSANKQLLLNDQLLNKYYTSIKVNPVIIFLDNLKADGFDSSYYIQTKIEDNRTYYYLYKYAFSISQKNNQFLIQINRI